MNISESDTSRQRLAAWAQVNAQWVQARTPPDDTSKPRLDALDCGAEDALTHSVLETLRHTIARQGWALYAAPDRECRTLVDELATQLQLGAADRTLNSPQDGLVELRDTQAGTASRYSPYSRRALGWHTDGYYNPPDRTIRAFILHCISPAARGGANALIDPRRVARRIWHHDPALLLALGAPDVMTIPANLVDGQVLRPQARVPVFAVADDGELVMRYTNRATHVRWRQDAPYAQALALLREVMDDEMRAAPRITLQPGQGLVCNNVLHCREAFEDDAGPQAAAANTAAATGNKRGRSMLRGRYLHPVRTPDTAASMASGFVRAAPGAPAPDSSGPEHTDPPDQAPTVSILSNEVLSSKTPGP